MLLLFGKDSPDMIISRRFEATGWKEMKDLVALGGAKGDRPHIHLGSNLVAPSRFGKKVGGEGREEEEVALIRLSDVDVRQCRISLNLSRGKVVKPTFLAKNDILVIAKGQRGWYLGTAFLVSEELARLKPVASANFVVIRPDTEKVHPVFLCAWLNTRTAQERMPFKDSTTVSFLQVKEFKTMQVPPLEMKDEEDDSWALRKLVDAIEKQVSEREMLLEYLEEKKLAFDNWLADKLSGPSVGSPEAHLFEEGERLSDTPIRIASRMIDLSSADTLVDPLASGPCWDATLQKAPETRSRWAVAGSEIKEYSGPVRVVPSLRDVNWSKKRSNNKVIGDFREDAQDLKDKLFEILRQLPGETRSAFIVNVDDFAKLEADADKRLLDAGLSNVFKAMEWAVLRFDRRAFQEQHGQRLLTFSSLPEPLLGHLLECESFFVRLGKMPTNVSDVESWQEPTIDLRRVRIDEFIKDTGEQLSGAGLGDAESLTSIVFSESAARKYWSPRLWPDLRQLLVSRQTPPRIVEGALRVLAERLRDKEQEPPSSELAGVFDCLCKRLEASLPPTSMASLECSPSIFAVLAAFDLQWFARLYDKLLPFLDGEESKEFLWLSHQEKDAELRGHISDSLSRASSLALCIAGEDEVVESVKNSKRYPTFAKQQLSRHYVARKLGVPETEASQSPVECTLDYFQAVEKFDLK